MAWTDFDQQCLNNALRGLAKSMQRVNDQYDALLKRLAAEKAQKTARPEPRRLIDVFADEDADSLTTGPKPGETWTVGTHAGQEFIGMAEDFTQQKFFIFQDPYNRSYFVISKDEFFGPDLPIHKRS